MGGREIIRGSVVDLMSTSCWRCCDKLELFFDWMLGWSVEEADEEEEEAGGDFALVEAAARLVVAVVVVVVVVDLLLVDMMNLGREVVAVVGRYGEEASGRVDRAERSWRGDGMMGIDGRVVWRKI